MNIETLQELILKKAALMAEKEASRLMDFNLSTEEAREIYVSLDANQKGYDFGKILLAISQAPGYQVASAVKMCIIKRLTKEYTLELQRKMLTVVDSIEDIIGEIHVE